MRKMQMKEQLVSKNAAFSKRKQWKERNDPLRFPYNAVTQWHMTELFLWEMLTHHGSDKESGEKTKSTKRGKERERN